MVTYIYVKEMSDDRFVLYVNSFLFSGLILIIEIPLVQFHQVLSLSCQCEEFVDGE